MGSQGNCGENPEGSRERRADWLGLVTKLLPRSFSALVAQLSVAAGGSFYVKQPLADIQWAHKGIAGKTQKALESDARIGWGW
ncbi:hypothetical protein TcasGA2_TC031303 [Tribolium castaneum]|uniref:Uncharacterized protein n=1 Tax=Tribolium castaneum TaxID=7070 RepID=A0A139W916_TRICA|nr:hypothetical protein TcasGA2_TC031303 [Tribolium castaneum]